MQQQSSSFEQLAEQTLSRCHLLAGFSETSGSITRTFLSRPMRDCHAAVAGWMSTLGMQVTVDAIGNIRGLLGSGTQPRMVIGSHLDTVPCAGAYDGVLGVCLALACVEAAAARPLSFDIEVCGFSEEEGVRFRTPFLGSRAVVGRIDSWTLALQDAEGRSLREAILDFGLDPAALHAAHLSDRARAFLEFHIEQGPVLERLDRSLAVVSAIAGQSRFDCSFEGAANHAGTTPMHLRRDALCGAAEWIGQVERFASGRAGLVATCGTIAVIPGATNIIPGSVRLSLDIRHAEDQVRIEAVKEIHRVGLQIANQRGLRFECQERLNQSSVAMDEELARMLEEAMEQTGAERLRIVSGAGHDAMIMAEKVPSAMLFLRSIGGISHHPDEAVAMEDVAKAIRVGASFLRIAGDTARWT